MTDFEQLRPDMDAQVENRLGDSISYSIGGAPAEIIVGFLSSTGDEGGLNGLDPLPGRKFVKINMERLPGGPTRNDRLTNPRLIDGAYRPAVDTIDTELGSWVFEIQRAPS